MVLNGFLPRALLCGIPLQIGNSSRPFLRSFLGPGQDRHLIPLLNETGCEPGAHESSSTRDQDFHHMPPFCLETLRILFNSSLFFITDQGQYLINTKIEKVPNLVLINLINGAALPSADLVNEAFIVFL